MSKAKKDTLSADKLKKALEDEDVQQFLAYDCGWGKHKGHTWKQVFEEDRSYFHWAVGKMNPNTKTYKMFSKLVPKSVRRANEINTAFKVSQIKSENKA